MSITLKNRQIEFRHTVAGTFRIVVSFVIVVCAYAVTICCMYPVVGITSMLRSRKNLEIGEWATIAVSRNTETQEIKLSVNEETPIRSIENGNMYALELKTHLFVGGYDSYKVKIAKQVDVETNFNGCIKMVKHLIRIYYVLL